eukprot:3840413-Lingulodinium_polyedra.AAC.1
MARSCAHAVSWHRRQLLWRLGHRRHRRRAGHRRRGGTVAGRDTVAAGGTVAARGRRLRLVQRPWTLGVRLAANNLLLKRHQETLARTRHGAARKGCVSRTAKVGRTAEGCKRGGRH